MLYKPDCKHFRGDVPCKPHKLYGVHCENCEWFEKREGRILVIKLGAIGDVIRTSVLLEPLQKQYPNYSIWWLSNTPEIVPSTVEKRMKFSPENLLCVEETTFDVAINLDKDLHACALMSRVKATVKHGYTLADGLPSPVNDRAQHKFITGIFDDVSKNNTKSYPQEMMEICGFEYTRQEYQIDPPGEPPFSMPQSGIVVGFNTGCGERWLTREWTEENWIELITLVQNSGFHAVLLGGKAEHDRNIRIQEQTGAIYNGTYPLKEFCAIVNKCHIVVTAVTMAMHIVLALRKQLVLMNNIFNPYEFELYGRGVIVEPPRECTCYFQQECTNPEYRCMDTLPSQTLYDAIMQRVPYIG